MIVGLLKHTAKRSECFTCVMMALLVTLSPETAETDGIFISLLHLSYDSEYGVRLSCPPSRPLSPLIINAPFPWRRAPGSEGGVSAAAVNVVEATAGNCGGEQGSPRGMMSPFWVVLCCVSVVLVLCCPVLCCAVLCCPVFSCVVLCCPVLCCVVVFYTTEADTLPKNQCKKTKHWAVSDLFKTLKSQIEPAQGSTTTVRTVVCLFVFCPSVYLYVYFALKGGGGVSQHG